jgi:hypothetical protein
VHPENEMKVPEASQLHYKPKFKMFFSSSMTSKYLHMKLYHLLGKKAIVWTNMILITTQRTLNYTLFFPRRNLRNKGILWKSTLGRSMHPLYKNTYENVEILGKNSHVHPDILCSHRKLREKEHFLWPV